MVKNPPAIQETQRHGFNPWLGKIPWRRTWQPTPNILAWEIPWTEEPGELQSTGVATEWLNNNKKCSWYVLKCYCVCLLTRLVMSDSETPRTVACQTLLLEKGRACQTLLQTRILKRVSMLSSRRSSQPRDRTQVSHVAGGFFTIWATTEAQMLLYLLFKIKTVSSC